MKLVRVTVTGIDERTGIVDLCHLRHDFPFVEFGILLSATREGKESRYPSREWVDRLFDNTLSRSMRFAGHLCGQWSRDAVGGPFLWAIERPEQFRRFQRLQFNGAPEAPAVIDRLVNYRIRFPDKEFILQTKQFALAYTQDQYEPSRLLDRSGGRGIELKDFPPPPSGARVGYAGGLGPDNLEQALTKITALPSDASFWVDAESGLRTDDWLDLGKVRRCLEIAKPFVEGKP